MLLRLVLREVLKCLFLLNVCFVSEKFHLPFLFLLFFERDQKFCEIFLTDKQEKKRRKTSSLTHEKQLRSTSFSNRLSTEAKLEKLPAFDEQLLAGRRKHFPLENLHEKRDWKLFGEEIFIAGSLVPFQREAEFIPDCYLISATD